MAFHFSLEPVLQLKRGQERVERLKLEAIHSEQSQTLTKLNEITLRHFESRRRFQRETAPGVTGSELQFEAAREDAVTRTRVSLEAKLVELEQRRNVQMQVYVKARRSRETFEKLRDRKFEIFRAADVRRQQQQLDDLFLMRQEDRHEE
jgi:flagellar export protein FliJ